MKSGWPDDERNWDEEYYQVGLRQLTDRVFVQRTFEPGPALVAREPQDGWRVEREYQGGEFDSDELELVEKRWDHQHCIVCYFSIKPGYSFWENRKGLIVCDICHDHLQSSTADKVG